MGVLFAILGMHAVKQVLARGGEKSAKFDIIGDIHGCASELRILLDRLSGQEKADAVQLSEVPTVARLTVFLGDFVDRGPDSVTVLRVSMKLCETGRAMAVIGNHDYKLLRALKGESVRATEDLSATIRQISGEPKLFQTQVLKFLESLPVYLVLAGGSLLVAHAGLPEHLHGSESKVARRFALYGDTSGLPQTGLPVRRDWAASYRGGAAVVYGHTPVTYPVWRNNTICIDTGCVFGGQLSALRWPERELVQVQAGQTYVQR